MADGPFSVADFSSQISKYGLASPNKFEVEFTRIPKEAGGAAELTQLNLIAIDRLPYLWRLELL